MDIACKSSRRSLDTSLPRSVATSANEGGCQRSSFRSASLRRITADIGPLPIEQRCSSLVQERHEGSEGYHDQPVPILFFTVPFIRKRRGVARKALLFGACPTWTSVLKRDPACRVLRPDLTACRAPAIRAFRQTRGEGGDPPSRGVSGRDLSGPKAAVGGGRAVRAHHLARDRPAGVGGFGADGLHAHPVLRVRHTFLAELVPQDCFLDWGMQIGRHCFSYYGSSVDAAMRPNPWESYPMFLPWNGYQASGSPYSGGGVAAAALVRASRQMAARRNWACWPICSP